MKPTPTRLALLISVIGLGMPAGQSALAEEDELAAPVPHASVEVVLGLSQAQPDADSVAAPVEAPVSVSVSPELLRRAIWALGLDDGTPAELHEPEDQAVAAVPVTKVMEPLDPSPDLSMVEKIDEAPPDASEPVAPLLAQLPAHVPSAPNEPAPARAREQLALPLREPTPPQQPPLQRHASTDDATPQPDEEQQHQASSDQASPELEIEETMFGRLGKLLRSIFMIEEAPHAVAQAGLTPSPAAEPPVDPAADAGEPRMADAESTPATPQDVTEAAAGPREIVVATHADKVLLSLAALRAADNEEGSAQTREIVVPTHSAKVLANLEEVQRDSRARHALEKRESVARVAVEAFEPIEQVSAMPALTEPVIAELEPMEPVVAEFEPIEQVSAIPVPLEPMVTAQFEPIEPVTAMPAPEEPLVAQAPVEFEKIAQLTVIPLAEPSTEELIVEQVPPPLDGVAIAMEDRRLDRVRGGFIASNGLQVSFGIERAVYINGNLVTTTSLNLSTLGKVTTGQGQPVSVDTSSLALIQSGSGNTFVPAAVSPTAVTTVIQNTLDGQKIQNLTVINATVNSLQILKGLQLQNSVTNAITDSLRR